MSRQLQIPSIHKVLKSKPIHGAKVSIPRKTEAFKYDKNPRKADTAAYALKHKQDVIEFTHFGDDGAVTLGNMAQLVRKVVNKEKQDKYNVFQESTFLKGVVEVFGPIVAFTKVQILANGVSKDDLPQYMSQCVLVASRLQATDESFCTIPLHFAHVHPSTHVVTPFLPKNKGSMEGIGMCVASWDACDSSFSTLVFEVAQYVKGELSETLKGLLTRIEAVGLIDCLSVMKGQSTIKWRVKMSDADDEKRCKNSSLTVFGKTPAKTNTAMWRRFYALLTLGADEWSEECISVIKQLKRKQPTERKSAKAGGKGKAPVAESSDDEDKAPVAGNSAKSGGKGKAPVVEISDDEVKAPVAGNSAKSGGKGKAPVAGSSAKASGRKIYDITEFESVVQAFVAKATLPIESKHLVWYFGKHAANTLEKSVTFEEAVLTALNDIVYRSSMKDHNCNHEVAVEAADKFKSGIEKNMKKHSADWMTRVFGAPKQTQVASKGSAVKSVDVPEKVRVASNGSAGKSAGVPEKVSVASKGSAGKSAGVPEKVVGDSVGRDFESQRKKLEDMLAVLIAAQSQHAAESQHAASTKYVRCKVQAQSRQGSDDEFSEGIVPSATEDASGSDEASDSDEVSEVRAKKTASGSGFKQHVASAADRLQTATAALMRNRVADGSGNDAPKSKRKHAQKAAFDSDDSSNDSPKSKRKHAQKAASGSDGSGNDCMGDADDENNSDASGVSDDE